MWLTMLWKRFMPLNGYQTQIQNGEAQLGHIERGTTAGHLLHKNVKTSENKMGWQLCAR